MMTQSLVDLRHQKIKAGKLMHYLHEVMHISEMQPLLEQSIFRG